MNSNVQPAAMPLALPAATSLRTTLIRRLALAALVPIALLGVGELASGYRTERRALTEQLAMSTVLSASAVDDFVRAHLSSVNLLASTSRVGEDWAPELRRLREQYPAMASALVTDARGNVLLSDPASSRRFRRVDDRQYFRIPAATGQSHVSDGFVGRVLGTDPLIAVSAPLFVDGRFAGVLQGSIRVDAFTRLRSAALRLRGFEMMVLDRQRRVVHASAGLPYRFEQNLRDPMFLRGAQPAAGVVTGRAKRVLGDGGDAFFARAGTRSGWTVVLFAPESVLYQSLARRLAVFLGMLLVAALGTWVVVQLQMRRFAEILDTFLAVLQGMTTRQPVALLRMRDMPLELQPLAQSIDELASRLDIAHYNNQELDRLNRTDALTGVLNRRGFEEHLAQRVDAQHGVTRVPVAALAFDIDHFKAYNDRYGHLAGDSALRRVASAVSGCLRGSEDVLARMGGEEFMAMLDEADVHTACQVAERARQAVSALGIPHGDAPTGVLTVSVGVYVAASGTRPLVLVQLADQALYRAKRDGRNRVGL
ncbi:diguanylate cyclase domain-containing protein [Agrilutibacter solisilvae]|uniref:diguanylate cyclase n=1 Tax=Agrilutibacter solisilvae TaxID=2763317 RepID=A0A974Y2W4_9GAMM|nr:diguanylate cyclase [Lysobacter solisilvae]QSX79455.1 diguanylate cyclase [Lysobacter solisilvae]